MIFFIEIVQQVVTLTKCMEAIWAKVFDKPEGSGVNKQGDEEDAGGSRNFFESDPLNYSPFTLLVQIQNVHGNPYTHNHERVLNHRPKGVDISRDDGAQWVCIDILDFHRKLDSLAFQDWLTSLKDYFEWYEMSAYCKVRFAKMKIKGKAQVWW